MNLRTVCFYLFIFAGVGAHSQSDSSAIRGIYDEALVYGEAYPNLRELCKDVGHRLSGSAGAARAVEWSYAKMNEYGFDKVWQQEVTVPHWVRGSAETCVVYPGSDSLDVLALGMSVGTEGQIQGEVVEFQSLQALKAAENGSLKGKIVFLNQPMNQKLIDTFHAYGSCADGRVYGADAAAEKGAIAFVMRSLGMRADDFPHTGVMVYEGQVNRIPAFALSTNSAHKLARMLSEHERVIMALQSGCQTLGDVVSHNVIAELTGSEYPEQYIVFGGHLDSWDVGEGAHDDGAGVVQALEVLRIFKALGIKPKYSLRCVFFMNEENGTQGGKVYARQAAERREVHLAALESDRGGFSPRGFTVDAPSATLEQLNSWLSLLEPYGIHFIRKGYGGVDIGPLKAQGTNLIGFVPDSQRYFDVHHTANDVFENVNERELQLGAASIASLVYLIDKYGLPLEIKP